MNSKEMNELSTIALMEPISAERESDTLPFSIFLLLCMISPLLLFYSVLFSPLFREREGAISDIHEGSLRMETLHK